MSRPVAIVKAGDQPARRGLRRAKKPSAASGPVAIPVPRGPRQTVRCDVVLPYTAGDERFLPQSANSILDQNYADVILHLIADGFEPGPYAHELAGEPNVRLYRNETSVGPYISGMRIFDLLETEFYAVQDADDVSLPDRIWDAITTLEKTGGDLFGACLEHFLDRESRDDSALRAKLAREPYHRSGVVWPSAPLGMCVNPTLVIRRSAIESINGWAGWKSTGDCEINTRARASGLKAIISPHLHGLRRLRSTSLSHGIVGVGTPERTQLVEELQRRYRLYTPGFDPRAFGALERVRREAETVRIR